MQLNGFYLIYFDLHDKIDVGATIIMEGFGF